MTNNSESGQPEWTAFRMGRVNSGSGGASGDCESLDRIFHVAHLEAAKRILIDGKIRAGLIFDESKLNKERILVTWCSPNDWSRGFRYGNVRFAFEFSKLFSGLRAYRVESIPRKTPACHILLTKNDYSGKLSEYDPCVGDGPWWFDQKTGCHYWNRNDWLEIMLERDLFLSECVEVNFVDHHNDFCSIDPMRCPERGLESMDAAGRFVSILIAENVDMTQLKLTDTTDGQVVPKETLRKAWWAISSAIQGLGLEYGGPVKLSTKRESAKAVAGAFLGALARDDKSSRDGLAALFESKDELLSSCTTKIAESFQLTHPEDLTKLPFPCWLQISSIPSLPILNYFPMKDFIL